MNNEVAHEYVTPRAPFFKTKVTIGKGEDARDVPLNFENGRLTITDADVAAELDRVLAENANLRSYIKKVDRDAALALVREHQREQAVKGATDTAALDKMRPTHMQGSTKTLGEIAPNNPEALEKFSDDLAHGDMPVTETVEFPPEVDVNKAQPEKPSGIKLK